MRPKQSEPNRGKLHETGEAPPRKTEENQRSRVVLQSHLLRNTDLVGNVKVGVSPDGDL